MISSFFLLEIIDKRMEKVLRPFVSLEVERLTNNIVNKKIIEMNLPDQVEEYITIKRNDGKIENITYNTPYINKVTNEVTRVIQDSLKNIDQGILDDYFLSERVKTGKFHHVKNGILCEVSLGSIRGSYLFANIGPTIPIRLLFLGQVNTEILVNTKDYGINNMMVEVYLMIKVQEMVSMPITSKKCEIVIKEPLSIEIIQGNLPKYVGRYLK